MSRSYWSRKLRQHRKQWVRKAKGAGVGWLTPLVEVPGIFRPVHTELWLRQIDTWCLAYHAGISAENLLLSVLSAEFYDGNRLQVMRLELEGIWIKYFPPVPVPQTTGDPPAVTHQRWGRVWLASACELWEGLGESCLATSWSFMNWRTEIFLSFLRGYSLMGDQKVKTGLTTLKKVGRSLYTCHHSRGKERNIRNT